MPNPFNADSAPSGFEAPSWDIMDVTTSDTVDLTISARAFYAHTAGSVKVLTATDEERTITVGAFQLIPTVVKRVFATGTTVDGVTVLFR